MPKTSRTPKPTQKEPAFFQQLHANCGGEIIPISNGKSLEMHCKLCRTQWVFYGLYAAISVPKDWVNFDPQGVQK